MTDRNRGADPMKPDAATLVALGSIARHAQEALSPTGHPLDTRAIESLLAQPNVREWMTLADSFGLLPVLR